MRKPSIAFQRGRISRIVSLECRGWALVSLLCWASMVMAVSQSPGQEKGSMSGIKGENWVWNGRFEKGYAAAMNPWRAVDKEGYLRVAVANRLTFISVSRSNEFTYEPMGYSVSFVDLDGDGLNDLVAADGAGFFWFFKNIGTSGSPKFGFGEVMDLLVDNELSRFESPFSGRELSDKELTPAQQREKERVDREREKAIERLERQNRRLPEAERLSEDAIEQAAAQEFPYSWERAQAEAAAQNRRLGETVASFNGYRLLRPVLAPCDWNKDGAIDFVVGDAQGTLYLCLNKGTKTQPRFQTYTKSQDRFILKLFPQYNPVTRRTTMEPVEFANYVTPWVVDWTGDGALDILMGEGTYSVNSVRLYTPPFSLSNTGAIATNEKFLLVGEERTFLAPSAWDWDGDGFLDLIVNDDKGNLSIHRNRNGAYRSGNEEMNTFVVRAKFEGQTDGAFLARCVPQPMDWNDDGVMDLIWVDHFGRIVYVLGKEKGSPEFGPVNYVRSTRLSDANKERTMVPVGRSGRGSFHSLSDVPTHFLKGLHGGTADARRFFSSTGGTENDREGWPLSRTAVHQFIFDYQFDQNMSTRDREPSVSWAVAPVPYGLWNRVDDDLGGGGAGKTLVFERFDPAKNSVFKSRPPLTLFNRGAAVHLSMDSDVKKRGAVPQYKGKPVARWDPAATTDSIKVAFRYRLEGDWIRMIVRLNGKKYRSFPIMKDGKESGPGYVDRHNYTQTLTRDNRLLNIGSWTFFEHVFPNPGTMKNLSGVDQDLHWIMESLQLYFYGDGKIALRDVAVGPTDLPPTTGGR